jgi:PPM family protein phosphatase
MRSPDDAARWSAAARFAVGGRPISAAAATAVGPMRRVNEDAVAVIGELGLAAVVDGMGGIASGVAAARIALDVITARVADGASLAAAFRDASATMLARSKAEPILTGIGATAAVARFTAAGAEIAHVGDCRAYRWRGGALTALTRDHDLGRALEEAAATPEQIADAVARHPTVVTRALGVADALDVEVTEAALDVDDRLVLVTDGVHRELDDDRLARLVADADPERAAAAVVEAAAADGRGRDNASVVVAVVRRAGER